MPDEKCGYLSDHPASEDGLNFDLFKPALRNILKNADTPLTLGVFGTWGSGKTTLLKRLKDELDAQKKPPLKTVWFTAWKYEQHEALWRAFMLRVVDGLHPRKKDGTRYQPDDFDGPTKKTKRDAILHLGRLERSIYETVNWKDAGQWSLDTGELVKQGIKLPIWLASHLAGLGSAAKDLGLNPDLAKLLEREVREHHMNQLSYMEQFADKFQEAVLLILGKKGRLVVFVDDLDRCLPEKAVEVLEAIKLFLDVPGTVFVLGMDPEVIRRGIESHYKAMLTTDGDDEIPINGEIYLQKLIQIPFNLPPLDLKSRVEFIQTLEKDLPADYRLEEVTRQVFGRGLHPNPRQVKRAMNIFYLLKQVAQEQEKHRLIPENLLAFPLLAKTVLIQSQWPELYKLWRQYPTLIQTLEDEYTRQPVSEDELLRGLSPEETFEVTPEGTTKTSRQAGSRSVARPPATGLLAPFLRERQKYALLAEMLRYPEETGDGPQRARFGGLKRAEVQVYVGLVGAYEQTAAESTATPQPFSADWLRELESGDPVKIREILAAIEESEPNPEGPLHTSLRGQLVVIAQNPDLMPMTRIATASAADALGFVPKDLYTFVPVKQNNILRYIARYPVTNLQYQRFLDPSNFSNQALWDEEGWEFLQTALNEVKSKGLPPLPNNWDASPTESFMTGEKNGGNVLLPRSWDDPVFGQTHKTAPVVGVSWHEAKAYCKWLLAHWDELEESRQGLAKPDGISLPNENEWVFAAGGDQNARFAFGELQNPAEEISRCANTSESGIGRTTPVWMYPQGKSPHNVMDMSGNVWEWQAYDKDQKSIALRGGSWNYHRDNARVSSRYNYIPRYGATTLGFRVLALPGNALAS